MIPKRAPRPPAKLITAGLNEQAANDEKMRGVRGHPLAAVRTLKFTAFEIPEVRALLEETFHGKCAYCEARYGAVMSVRVEHYRPKGRVDLEDRSSIGGYYWLAAEWTNLLPSCEDCNIAKKHFIPSLGREEKVGKGNRFPLFDEGKRARRKGEEAVEFPLLMHPYFDAPERLLSFDEKGGVEAIRRLRGKERKKAETSILVYGLGRLKLVKARHEHAKRVLAQITKVLETCEDLKTYRANRFRDRLQRDWEDLQRLLEANEEYNLASRQVAAKKLGPIQQRAIKAALRKPLRAQARD